MHDSSKEPQEQDNNSTSSSEKIIDFELLWRCISKIRNEDPSDPSDSKEVHKRRNNKKRIIKNLNTLYVRICYWRTRRRPIDVAFKLWFDASFCYCRSRRRPMLSYDVIPFILISIVVVVVVVGVDTYRTCRQRHQQ